MERGYLESNPPPPHLPRDGSKMRYLVILDALRRHWEVVMTDAHVDPQIIRSWGFYFHQLSMQAATCKASELEEVGRKIAKSFATCTWYIERTRVDG